MIQNAQEQKLGLFVQFLSCLLLIYRRKLQVSFIKLPKFLFANLAVDKIIKVEKAHGVYNVTPASPALLLECQSLYNTRRSAFSAAEVYVTMMKFSSRYTFETAEGNWLRFIMRETVCKEGVYDSNEGSLIRIALALQRKVLVRVKDSRLYDNTRSDILEQEVTLEKFEPLLSQRLTSTGLWRIDVSFPDFSYLVSKQGTLRQLSESFRFML